MPYTIAQLNQFNQTDFVAAIGAIYEHTPEIAAQAWGLRPFANLDDLHQKLVSIVQAMPMAAQLQLIRAHPDLGSKAKMAVASVQEQAGAGLDRLLPTEYDRFQHLNQTYQAKFGFPFIIAVKNHTKASILAAFEQRLTHSAAVEQAQAIAEINQIARFRLLDLVP